MLARWFPGAGPLPEASAVDAVWEILWHAAYGSEFHFACEALEEACYILTPHTTDPDAFQGRTV